jgi:hypothetical protein
MMNYAGSLFLDMAQQRLLDLNRAHANDRLVHLARATANQRLAHLTRDDDERRAQVARSDASRFVARSVFARLGRRYGPSPAA